jgi:peroxiredoxin
LVGTSVSLDNLSNTQWLTPAPNTDKKFVLLDFWRTICPPCIGNIKKLNSFHEKFGDRLVVIALSPEAVETIDKVKVGMKIQYALGIDKKRWYEKDVFGVKSFPNVALIDPNGVVCWQGNPSKNAHDLTDKKIEEIIAQFSFKE